MEDSSDSLAYYIEDDITISSDEANRLPLEKLNGFNIKRKKSQYFTVQNIDIFHLQHIRFNYLREGDRVESINNMNISGWTNKQMKHYLKYNVVECIEVSNSSSIRETRIHIMQKHGCLIEKEKATEPFIVLDAKKSHDTVQSKGIIYGSVIYKINGRDISNWNNADMVNFLWNENIESIESSAEQSLQRNGCVLRKLKGKQYFSVVAVNVDHECIRNHAAIVLHYYVMSINEIAVSRWTNIQMDVYLQKETIESIVTKKPRNKKSVENCGNPTSEKRIEMSWNQQCRYGCGYIHLSSAKKSDLLLCCQGGSLREAPTNLQPLSNTIQELFEENGEHLSRASSMYNNMLAMCATKVINDRGGGFEHNIVSDSCVKINGRTYHFFPQAANSNDPSGGLSYFMFDADEAIQTHAAELNNRNGEVQDIVRLSIVRAIKNYLKTHNKYAKELQFIGETVTTIPTIATAQSAIRGKVDYFEVAFITSDSTTGERVLQINGQNGSRSISMDDKEMEPIAYPLLFLHGEDGYSRMPRTKVNYFPYLASRFLRPDLTIDNDIWMLHSADNKTIIPSNRFQLMARLSQVYLVDMVSRGIDQRLRWIQRNQNVIFSGAARRSKRKRTNVQPLYTTNPNESDSDTENGYTENSNVEEGYLPSSFFGSRRYLRDRALNALTLVSEFGKATGFLTLTCNSKWPEILSRLLPGQSAFDRPDITCQVFKHRLRIFLQMLRSGAFFDGQHKIEYLMYVIEYQHRGLPHAHIVYKLTNTPKDANETELEEFINNHFTAELPQTNDTVYYDLVKKHMIHHCSTQVNGCKLTSDDKCKRGYSDYNPIISKTKLDDRGFPIYRRRSNDDKRVVPHNRNMLLAWDGHANHEYAGDVKSVLYLYKYLYKGAKKVKIDVTTQLADKTEIELYVSGRFLCSMDACWRIFGYQTYPAPTPRVQKIKVKLEEQVRFDLQRSNLSDIAIYFARPLQLNTLTILEFFTQYIVYRRIPPARYREEVSTSDVFKLQIEGYDSSYYGDVYVCKRCRTSTLCRLQMLYITAGDIWYLRLILLRMPVLSFDEAKSWNGTFYKSYQQSALARGLVTEHAKAVQCFMELIAICTPQELRGLFCTMMTQGFPMRPIIDNRCIKDAMMQDFMERNNNNEIFAERLFWLDIKSKVEQHSSDKLEKYGFESPDDDKSELTREQYRYGIEQQKQLLFELNSTAPNNEEQQKFFDHIYGLAQKAPINSTLNVSSFHFLSGVAGAGKTEVCKKLIAAIRSLGHIVLICASTSLAACNYDNCYTAHSLFKYPVDEDENDSDATDPVTCKLFKTQRATLLRHTKFIFWDEFVNNDRRLFEAVMQYYEQSKLYCNFICIGDFRQIPPVVKNGNPKDIMKALISASPYWDNFNRTHLQQNMRLRALRSRISDDTTDDERSYVEQQEAFANNILCLAEGRESSDYKLINIDNRPVDQYTNFMVLKNITFFSESESSDALKWLYGEGIFDPYLAVSRCILAATNESGDCWNYSIMTHITLQNAKSNGVPPHTLQLKVGDICIVLRHLPALNLATNQRIRITGLYTNTIQAQPLRANYAAERVFIPRIRFKFSLCLGSSYKVMRTQFPLRPAYCMTYNKSQGQTFERVLLDITQEPFVHGHCYVAMSRVQDANQIAIFCRDDQVLNDTDGTKVPVMCNIVYKDIIKNNYSQVAPAVQQN